MVGVGPRVLAIFALLAPALSAGCATHSAVRRARGPGPARGQNAAVYRYVSLGVTSPMDQQRLDAGRIGVIADNAREVVALDGSVEQAPNAHGEGLMGGVPVPARLGGGFLFWGNALYRARSFTGPLEAITDIPSNELGVEFGPDFALILLAGAPPRAFAFDPPRAARQSPHGVIDVAATDDGRAVALDATGRALASTDAGKSWRDVTRAVGGVQGVRSEGSDVGFVLRQSPVAWLRSDGSLGLRPPAPAPAAPEQQVAALLERAVAGGLRLPGAGTRALVGDKSGLRVVDLEAGTAEPATLVGPPGSTCTPVSLDDEGVAVCLEYGSKPTTTVISHALGAKSRVEKIFPGALGFKRGVPLMFFASCAGVPSEGVVCNRRSASTFVEVSVSPEVLKAWQPMFWVSRWDDAVVVARARDPRSGNAALIEPKTGTVTPLDQGADQIVPGDHGGASFALYAVDHTLHGFTKNGSIVVDPKGHVTLGPRTFASVESWGAHALARDNAEHLWQSSDFGSKWTEVDRPPFDASPEGVGARVNPRPSGRATSMQCSLVGCALEHPSGTGYWLRLGWPAHPPRAPVPTADTSPSTAPAPTPPGAVPPLPSPVLPKLRCAVRTPGPLHAPKSLPRAASPKVRPESVPIFAGKSAAALRAPVTNIAFRDVYTGEETYVHYGLRAALTLAASGPDPLVSLLDHHLGFELLFTEPFDFTARTRRVAGALRGWEPKKTPAAKGARGRELRSELDGPEGVVRPVLSAAPGHGGGLLLLDGGFAYWAKSSGQLVAIHPFCSPSSGYVGPSGTLFVACADPSGATRIEDAASGLTQLVLRGASYSRNAMDPGLRFFPPGEPLFVNPDAIAVAGDGKPRILRLPPGDEPPTLDNPAWILSSDAAPVELAPWSTLELATSPACAHGDGYRAIVQSGKSWLSLDGAPGFRPQNGMTALVRWSAERVCLEAVEVGYSELEQGGSPALRVSAVARFVGAEPGAGFVGMESNSVVREPAKCELEGAPAPQP
jgi:hypothetical protein